MTVKESKYCSSVLKSLLVALGYMDISPVNIAEVEMLERVMEKALDIKHLK